MPRLKVDALPGSRLTEQKICLHVLKYGIGLIVIFGTRASY